MTQRVALEYPAGDETVGTVVGAVEILDADLCPHTGAPVLAGEPSYAEVIGPGRYVARGRLAEGTWIGGSFQVSADSAAAVNVRLERSGPGPDRPDGDLTCWAVGLLPSRRGWYRVDVDAEVRPDRVEFRSQTGGSLPENFTVLLGGDGLPGRFVVMPVGATLRLVRSGLSVQAELSSGADSALLSFLNDGDLVCARIIADHLLIQRRRGLLADLALGYHLIATADDRAPSWVDRALGWFGFSPDVMVMKAWSNPGDAGAFRRLLLSAVETGPPAVGMGLGLLRDGLYMLDDTDPTVAEAIRTVRRYQLARLPGILTSYYGDNPGTPVLRAPAIGVPPGVETFVLSSGPPPSRPLSALATSVRGIAENFFTARLATVTYFDAQNTPGRPSAATLDLTEDARRLLGPDVTGSVSLRRGTLRVTLARLGDQTTGATVHLTIGDRDEITMISRGGAYTAELPWSGDLPEQLGFRVEADGDDRF